MSISVKRGLMADDGGPAFACAAENGHQAGMSLRDYFAGQALVGLLAQEDPDEAVSTSFDAEHAYRYADSMLAAREDPR